MTIYRTNGGDKLVSRSQEHATTAGKELHHSTFYGCWLATYIEPSSSIGSSSISGLKLYTSQSPNSTIISSTSHNLEIVSHRVQALHVRHQEPHLPISINNYIISEIEQSSVH